MRVRHASFPAIFVALTAAACAGGTTTTTTPSSGAGSPVAPPAAASAGAPSSAPATFAATDAPASIDPGASLDPTQSDAGIAARVTISNDTRGGRDGTHDIYGIAGDGSECDGAFENGFVVVAWYDGAPQGTIRQFSIGVEKDDVPEEDGTTSGIEDGRVSFDFASETGVGTRYTGDAASDGQGSSTIDITRAGSTLTFDFDGVTFAGVQFTGQLMCADASD
jgi:hypothetical protein